MSTLHRSWLFWFGMAVGGCTIGSLLSGMPALQAFGIAVAHVGGGVAGLGLSLLGLMMLIDWWTLRPIKSRRHAERCRLAMFDDGTLVKCPMCSATWHKSAIPDGLKSHVE